MRRRCAPARRTSARTRRWPGGSRGSYQRLLGGSCRARRRSTARRRKGSCGLSCSYLAALRDDGRTAESQLDELRNMRVLLEEARLLARTLVYYRRARLEAVLRRALDEVDLHIEELRSQGRG